MLDLPQRLLCNWGESRKVVRLEEGRLLRQGRKSLVGQWLWLLEILARKGLRAEMAQGWQGAPERME